MIENTYECAPKIWKKFSEAQKEVFNNFCDQFGTIGNQWAWAHPEMPKIDGEHYVIMRHNLACFAAWSTYIKKKNTYQEV